jgi:uncharacterized glyoxalase superfamily protein PhnB
MLTNRSIPRCTVIPELAYPDVTEAADWLCKAFGFTVRLRIANHRVQLNVGDGAMVVTERRDLVSQHDSASPVVLAHAVMVRVEDAHAHHARAKEHGARILNQPTDYPYGERQYTVVDPGGHCWKFTQSIADIHPSDWGGTPGEL